MSNYGINDPEFYGKIPIRREIEVLPADEAEIEGIHDQIIITSKGKFQKGRKFQLGWSISEKIGIGIVNTRGVAAAKKTVII